MKPQSSARRKHPLSTLLALCLALVLVGAQSYAQTASTIKGTATNAKEEAQINGHPNEGRWFQVEMIVFSQTPTQRDLETWPTNIAIAYPPNWKQLEDLSMAEHIDPESVLINTPYYKIPEAQRLLNNNVRDLSRAKGHRVLFHEAWRQQVWSGEESPSLLVSGGQQYGDHFELEGSVQLSVARYLHLKTNLWFTEFQHNYGQANTDYPPLPLIPSKRLKTSVHAAPSDQQSPWESVELLSNEYEKILEEPYISSRIITMQQKRRMRSKEIHYVDHPVIGVLIYILPYELPALDESSAAAQSPDAAPQQTVEP